MSWAVGQQGGGNAGLFQEDEEESGQEEDDRGEDEQQGETSAPAEVSPPAGLHHFHFLPQKDGRLHGIGR